MKRAHLIKNYYRKLKRKNFLLQLHLMSQVVQIKISAVQKNTVRGKICYQLLSGRERDHFLLMNVPQK